MNAPPPVQASSISDMCFLQALFVHRCLRYGEARRIAIDIYGTDDHDVFKDALARVGQHLYPLKMKTRKLKHFNDGQNYLAIVNELEDKSAKISSKYTFGQLQFFNHIVCSPLPTRLDATPAGEENAKWGAQIQIEMIASQEGEAPGVCSIGINEAMNVDVTRNTQLSQVSEELLESGQVKLSMQQKESTLEQLKQDMWLGGDENEIYIGARAFMELRNHLLSLDLPEETHQAWSAAL